LLRRRSGEIRAQTGSSHVVQDFFLNNRTEQNQLGTLKKSWSTDLSSIVLSVRGKVVDAVGVGDYQKNDQSHAEDTSFGRGFLLKLILKWVVVLHLVGIGELETFANIFVAELALLEDGPLVVKGDESSDDNQNEKSPKNSSKFVGGQQLWKGKR